MLPVIRRKWSNPARNNRRFSSVLLFSSPFVLSFSSYCHVGSFIAFSFYSLSLSVSLFYSALVGSCENLMNWTQRTVQRVINTMSGLQRIWMDIRICQMLRFSGAVSLAAASRWPACHRSSSLVCVTLIMRRYTTLNQQHVIVCSRKTAWHFPFFFSPFACFLHSHLYINVLSHTVHIYIRRVYLFIFMYYFID